MNATPRRSSSSSRHRCGVRVVIRLRPVGSEVLRCLEVGPPREGGGDAGATADRSPSDGAPATITLTDRRYSVPERMNFEFPGVWGEGAKQDALYAAEVAPMLPAVAAGRSKACMFAYGPTGTGKTHTLQGTEALPGIIPRLAADLFTHVPTGATVTLSLVEVYQERLYDLLVPAVSTPATPGATSATLTSRRPALKLMEVANGRAHVVGLKEVPVASVDEFKAVYAAGCSRRTTGATRLNAVSSRSHALLTIKVRPTDTDVTGSGAGRGASRSKARPLGALYIVDLAGNEDNRKTDNAGVRMAESNSINTSLFVLGKVINAINRHEARVPYRDSKLTRLLHDCLEGSRRAVMFCTVHPGDGCSFQTKHTLAYAAKAAALPVAGLAHKEAVTPAAAGAAEGAAAPTPSRQEQLEAWRAARGIATPRRHAPSTPRPRSTARRRPGSTAGRKRRRLGTSGRTGDACGGAGRGAGAGAPRSPAAMPAQRLALPPRTPGRPIAGVSTVAATPAATPAALHTQRLRPSGVLDEASQRRLEGLEARILRRSMALHDDVDDVDVTSARVDGCDHGSVAVDDGDGDVCMQVEPRTSGDTDPVDQAVALFERATGRVALAQVAPSPVARTEVPTKQKGPVIGAAASDDDKENSGQTTLERLNQQVKNVLELQLVTLLNTGGTEALLGLKGIGVKRAARIVEERKVAPFAQLSDLTRIGLSQKQVAKLCRSSFMQQLHV